MKLRIAARQSALAQWQAREVGRAILASQRLESDSPLGSGSLTTIEIEYQFRESLGDQRGEDPLWKMPAKGVFTEDFVADLQEGRADLVVHSWKDLPTDPRPGLEILATLPRASAEDVLLIKPQWRGGRLSVFTSSPRRSWALPRVLSWALPASYAVDQFEFRPVRGNIATRLKKWRNDASVDAIVVALAALDRLLEDESARGLCQSGNAEVSQQLCGAKWMILPLSEFPTAPAQGALAIEGRADRSDLRKLLSRVHCSMTAEAAERERDLLRAQGGGCHQKLGVSVRSIRQQSWWTVVRGESESGRSLNDEVFSAAWPEVSRDRIFGCLDSDQKFWKREPLVVAKLPWTSNGVKPSGPRGLLVSRTSAWPHSDEFRLALRNQDIDFVFCAGVKSWRQLAQNADVWINACADSLGEEYLPAWKRLARAIGCGATQRDPEGDWDLYRLTNEAAPEGGEWKSWSTYRVLPETSREEELRARLSDCTHYYWMSRQQFEYCVRLVPELKMRISGCGPGRTYVELQNFWNQVKAAGEALGPLDVVMRQALVQS
jgi:hydroxymethylbilane synthase